MRERASVATAACVTLFILVAFSASLLSREIRLLAALLCAAVAIGHPAILMSFFRTPVGRVLSFIPVMGLFIFFLQNIFGLSGSNELALRQIIYYVIFPLSCVCFTVIVIKYERYAFNFYTASFVLAASSILALTLSDTWIYGPYVIRGNLENTTVYLLVVFLVFQSRSHVSLVFVILLYTLYSIFTEAGQGVMLSILFLAFLLMPTEKLKRLMLSALATLPFLFPAVALLANDSVNQIDQNVDFRRIVWRQIYQDFLDGSLVLGQLGQVVNRDFVDLLMRYGVAWEGAENIGAHNFPLQMTQLFGISGLIAAMAFFIALLRMTLPLASYPGVAFCFLAVVVSLTLNQAEAHLLYQLGTALLVGCISAAYISSEVSPHSRYTRVLRTR